MHEKRSPTCLQKHEWQKYKTNYTKFRSKYAYENASKLQYIIEKIMTILSSDRKYHDAARANCQHAVTKKHYENMKLSVKLQE